MHDNRQKTNIFLALPGKDLENSSFFLTVSLSFKRCVKIGNKNIPGSFPSLGKDLVNSLIFLAVAQ